MIENHFAKVILELFGTFPFALSGYHDPDKEYVKFFRRICRANFLFPESNFLISGFAKLEEEGNLAMIDIAKWKTKSLRYFLFEDLYSGDTEYILSLYISTLEYFTPGRRVVNIISSNVFNSINIQVEICPNVNVLDFSFRKGQNTLLIKFPEIYFNKGITSSLTSKWLQENRWPDTLLVSKDAEDYNSFSINENANGKTKEEYEDLIKIIFKEKSIDETKKLNLNSYSSLKKALKNHSVNSEDLISLSYASAFLCKIFNTKLMYFVSTANFENGKYFSLGAMGIGIPINREISTSEKMFYRLMVDHIASNLAVQVIRNNNIELSFKNKRFKQTQLLKKFDLEILKINNELQDLSHGTNKVSNEDVKKWKDFKSQNHTELIDAGLFHFIARVDELFISGKFIDRHFFTEFHEPGEKVNKENCNLLKYLPHGKSLKIIIANNRNPKVNTSLPHAFIEHVITNSKRYIRKEGKNFKIQTWALKNFICIRIEYNRSINLSMLHIRLLNPTENGSFVTFIRGNYDNFLTVGNFYIFSYESLKEDVSIPNLIEHRKYLFSCFHDLYKDDKVVRRKLGVENELTEYSDLLYVFEFKSII